MTPRPGQLVRTRLLTASGHTRLPGYARGRVGRVVADRGSYPLPDELVRSGRADPEPLFSVRFAARDLWGAGDHDIYLDLYLSYLEPLEEAEQR